MVKSPTIKHSMSIKRKIRPTPHRHQGRYSPLGLGMAWHGFHDRRSPTFDNSILSLQALNARDFHTGRFNREVLEIRCKMKIQSRARVSAEVWQRLRTLAV